MRFRPTVSVLEGRDLCSGLFSQTMVLPTDPASSPQQQIYQPGVGEMGTGSPMMLVPTDPASSPSGPVSTDLQPTGDFNPVGGSSMLV